MGTTRTVVARLALVAVVGAAIGGCGGDDDGGGGATEAGAGGDGAGAAVPLDGPVNDEGSVDLTAEGTDEVAIEAGDDSFSPTFVEAEPGQVVSVEVRSASGRDHTFSIGEQDVSEAVAPGSSVTVEVTVPADGAVEFFCEVHGGSGMRGAFFSGSGGDGSGAGGDAGAGSDTGSGGNDDDGGGAGEEPASTEAPAVGYGY